MTVLFLAAVGFQAVLLLVDEFYFHMRRSLPPWERIGHPVDTFSFILPLAVVVFAPRTEMFEWLYIGFAVVSCLCITKDEWVHRDHSSAMENWLHSMLFILHPVILISVYGMWPDDSWSVAFLFTMSCGFMFYQIVYWNFWRREPPTSYLKNAVKDVTWKQI